MKKKGSKGKIIAWLAALAVFGISVGLPSMERTVYAEALDLPAETNTTMEDQEALLSDEVAAESDFQYRELDDGGIEITKYTGSMENLIIPAQIDGKSVTSIGYEAFYDCSSLSSVEIPDNVTSIGEEAFAQCSNLSSIEIPNSVTSIEEQAFGGCSSLSNIKIPSSVTSIGEMAFHECSSLRSIEIPDSVTRIGDSTFSECSSLSNIKIPSGVTSIGTWAFSWCSSLSSIEIPSSVTDIGYCAFSGCSSLRNIEIPDSVTSIGNSTFSGCSNLNSIKIPSSITDIGSNVFYGCSSLRSIEIPDSVTIIGSCAFQGCSSLSSIKIPSSVTYIGYDMFSGCNSDLVIKGEAGSCAQSYASDNYIKFVVIGSDEDLGSPGTSNNVTVAKKSYSLMASEKKQTIADLGAKATGGTITYRSNNRSVTVNSQGKVTVAKNFIGTAKITVTAAGAGYQTAAVTVTITVTKAPQSITKAITKKSVKRSAKAQSFKIGARAAGKVTYTVTKKDAKKILTVNREGKVTIKKNARAGTYTVKVRATAAAKGIYKKTAKTYTIRVTVKK